MRALDLWATERDAAEVLECGIRVIRQDTPPVAKLWNPKATKPTAYYRFRSVERREQFIDQYVTNYCASIAARQARKDQRQAATAEHSAEIGVGQVFVYSWGYDQTNVDYFQVIEKHGLMLTVQEIGSSIVPGSEGYDSARVEPRLGHFLDKAPIKKRLQFNEDGTAYLAFDYGWCSLWRGGAHYASWYA